jgi:hypothetical protein
MNMNKKYEQTKMVRIPVIKPNNNTWIEGGSRNKTETDTELLERKKLFEKISKLEDELNIRQKREGENDGKQRQKNHRG